MSIKGAEESAEPIRSATDRRLAGPLLTLHAATDVENLWRAGVAVLRAAMPGFHYLMGLPSVGAMPILLRTTLPVPNEPDYWARLDRVAPLEKMIAGKVGRKVGRLSDEVPFLLLRFTPFYRQFMKPEGWRYSAGLFFWEGERFLGQFSQNRTPEHGDYTDAELALLVELHPHFETAIHRVLILDRERTARLSMEESIQRSPLPTAVLDWDLAPLYHNRAAAEATAIWRLGPQAARALKPHFELPADLAAACRELGCAWEQGVLTSLRERISTPERIVAHHALPSCQALLRLFEGDRAHFTKPHFLVQWSLLHLPDDEEDGALKMLALLTPAEREVAQLAARGLENGTIAGQLGVSHSTVRTHLRSTFAKLDITSRTRLAVLLRAPDRPPKTERGESGENQ